jgi:NAD(P)-dependent dehydrogenase (short-subunit alcohol dehydrogenase family)
MSNLAIYPSLKDRVVFISGGGSGIGGSIVEEFCQQGAKVAFVDIDSEASEALVARMTEAGYATPLFLKCDLYDISALQAAIAEVQEKLGTIRVLINNAARDDRHDIDDVTPEYWDDRMAVNLKHHFFAAQAVHQGMAEAGGGVIINMGSVSWMVGMGGMPGYTTAKAAIAGLTRSLARDLGPSNIRVNCVVPGHTWTQRQIDLWTTPEMTAALMERQCLKRKILPDEVARIVLFFSSDDAAACTNQTYIVDGGLV